jgi:hypothetical protein
MKLFRIIFFLPGVLILAFTILQFVFNPKYKFPEPHAFKGEYLYNPYNGIDSSKWEKANFHAHNHIFVDLFNGTANSKQLLDSFYTYFEYNIIGISDYQKIDRIENEHKQFIPIYEHGYQYYKNHQLVINAKKVNWLDYIFRQTLNNKQFIIDRLRNDSTAIITIVHPDRRKAYSLKDFRYLANYNCLEIANNECLYTSSYDTILSSGHPVFLMADDDTHNLAKENDGCHSFNLINSDLVKDSILNAIRKGRLIGVNLNVSCYKTNAEKKAGLQKLPGIKNVTLNNDTLTVILSQPVKTIKFIGQKGIARKTIRNSAIGSYFFSKEDTYIRTEIECHDGTIYFFNPVFRYDGHKLTDYAPSPDLLKTWLWCSFVLVVFLLIFAFRKFVKLKLQR